MKTRHVALLAGVSMPMILSGPVDAGFLGIKQVFKGNPYGLHVVNLYAVFDRPGEDHLLAVAGTPNAPLTVEVFNGTFYQHPFGTDVAPNPDIVDVFPSLAFDTFVTIGEKLDVDGTSPTLSAFWPGFGASSLLLTNDAWSVTPNNPLGDPFNPDTPGAAGQVLIAQFATADGIGFEGVMKLFFISNGVSDEATVFFGIPAPGAAALLGLAGLLTARRRRGPALPIPGPRAADPDAPRSDGGGLPPCRRSAGRPARG